LSVRHKHADCSARLALLRARRRERPREGRAADKPDEFASFHRITSR
jgi:hypothetical protein